MRAIGNEYERARFSLSFSVPRDGALIAEEIKREPCSAGKWDYCENIFPHA